MSKRIRPAIVMVCVFPLLCGALFTECGVGGLKAADFQQVNVNGFDEADNAVDMNHYAYAMKYFQADGADQGYVYVGTGNNVAGLVGYYIETLLNGGDILDAPVRPPEIRRYRPDLGPLEWETVLDYRDVETDPDFETIGFRFMTTLWAADGRKTVGPTCSNYLYAATQGNVSALWRSATGNSGDWYNVFTLDTFGASIRWIEQHDGLIYLAVAYDSFGEEPPPGEIWVSDDGLSFVPLMQDGFGNPDNRGIQALISYNGWLYAGTKNDVTGFEIWKLAGPDKPIGAIKVVDGGGPSAHNENAGMPFVFNGKLYFGTQLYIGGVNPTSGNAFQGCDIIRIDENDNWETIVGPDSLSGYESGFNHFTNAYLWWMEEHDGWLYAGTYDQGSMLAYLLANLEEVMAMLEKTGNKDAMTTVLALLDRWLDEDDYYRLMHAGADLFKTQNGVDWYPVTLNGLDNPHNYGWRTMEAAPDGYLYLGSANPTEGLQIWRAKTPEE
ncbi:MAG: hypothetical protein JXR94_18165 [Candidatus Hydrogenedentes bacterium]|nr:hypothetical protein [Candidatus Hydrogenedentota bacterium]